MAKGDAKLEDWQDRIEELYMEMQDALNVASPSYNPRYTGPCKAAMRFLEDARAHIVAALAS